jgi:hypothetical protein|tara:strand:+ start:538 stop:810 length:273 start_codon:yes stop_codon:yes gene_type:complete
MKIENVPMVRVTWMDAMDGETGWQELETIMKGNLATCVDVGWLVKNTEQTVVVMGSWCVDPDDKNGGRYITIPKGWVKKIEYLKVDYANV